MILSFGDWETEKIWNGERSLRLPQHIQIRARRKLRILNNVTDLGDLRIPPSNPFEKLSGDLDAFYRIRINRQWRIIFVWHNKNILNVSIVDYH